MDLIDLILLSGGEMSEDEFRELLDYYEDDEHEPEHSIQAEE